MLLNIYSLLCLLFLAPVSLSNPACSPRVVMGLDSARRIPAKTFRKAYSQGFRHFVGRIYQEMGRGQIDPTFLGNYNRARQAGFTVSAFWFPCTGKVRSCNDIHKQARDTVDYINQKKLDIHHLWFDIEVSSVHANWNYGRDNGGNVNKAREVAAALKSAYPQKYGLYSTPGEWFNIFGSKQVAIDNQAHLWWGTWDYKPRSHWSDQRKWDDIKNLPSHFGGWTNKDLIIGRQYTNESSSGLFNLNTFVNPCLG